MFSFLPTIHAQHTPHCVTLDPQGRLVGVRGSDIRYDSRVFYLRGREAPAFLFKHQAFGAHAVVGAER